MAILKIKTEKGETYFHNISKIILSIGRSPENDIVIDDIYSSRFHAQIIKKNDNFLIKDLDSANGTFLNSHKIEKESELKNGDIVIIGKTEIEFIDINIKDININELSDNYELEFYTNTDINAISQTTVQQILSLIDNKNYKNESLELSALTNVWNKYSTETKQDLLRIICNVGIALLPHTSIEDTLRIIMESVFDAIPAERGFLFLKEREDLKCKLALDSKKNELNMSNIKLSNSIIQKVMEECNSVISYDAMKDPRFKEKKSVMLRKIRSVMAVPLYATEEVLGMIYVDNPIDNKFNQDNLMVLSTIASVASIKIENHNMLNKLFERKRIEEELKLAAEIQLKLQPSFSPTINGWDIAGKSIQCYAIGGDYYDFIEDNESNKIIIALGDVSGKGIAAALLMSSLHTAVSIRAKVKDNLSKIISEINKYIFNNTPPNKFATLFYSELDYNNNILNYCNAGNNPPLLIKQDGEIIKLSTGGIPIGIDPDYIYLVDSIIFNKGDILVIYSDGITEAINEEEQEFGEMRLIDLILQNRNEKSLEIINKIYKAINNYSGSVSQQDDMTIIIIAKK